MSKERAIGVRRTVVVVLLAQLGAKATEALGAPMWLELVIATVAVILGLEYIFHSKERAHAQTTT
jgi:hypothetical protein